MVTGTFQKAFIILPWKKDKSFTERFQQIPEQINSPFNITEVFVNGQSFYFFWCLSKGKHKLCIQRPHHACSPPFLPLQDPYKGF